MNIVLLIHPNFMSSASMPRFADMLTRGMSARGHNVSIMTAKAFFYKLPFRSATIKKWLGYFDQFLVFPVLLRFFVLFSKRDVLFVFADQALGPWVAAVKNRKHVVHVHDFMALRSALGEFSQNKTRWSGRVYQAYIRHGFSTANNFISVSGRTENDLRRFCKRTPQKSVVIHNGLNFDFCKQSLLDSIRDFPLIGELQFEKGFILHVGGNQWYKNRMGVLNIYAEYLKISNAPLPLLMLGAPPLDEFLVLAHAIRGNGGLIYFYSEASNEQIRAAYSSATALLFPSIAEGFGWPIIEAMACGCPVITTDDDPMREVGGSAAYYFDLNPSGDWRLGCRTAANILLTIVNMSGSDREKLVESGYINARRFDPDLVLDAYEEFYENVLSK